MPCIEGIPLKVNGCLKRDTNYKEIRWKEVVRPEREWFINRREVSFGYVLSTFYHVYVSFLFLPKQQQVEKFRFGVLVLLRGSSLLINFSNIVVIWMGKVIRTKNWFYFSFKCKKKSFRVFKEFPWRLTCCLKGNGSV